MLRSDAKCPLPFLRSPLAAFVLATTVAGAFPSAADDTTALRATIERLKDDNAELAKLADYADALRDLSSTDPASARAARAPMERCRNTPLRQYCPLLRGLFQSSLEK